MKEKEVGIVAGEKKADLIHPISIQSKGTEQDWCKVLTVAQSVVVHHKVIGFASM